jgi:antirestriction protein ArdC
MTKADVYESVTTQVIAALKEGTAPWRMPFISGYPVNIHHGKRYRGWNVFALMLESMAKGYGDSRWGTFKACKEAAVAQARSEGRKIVEKKVKRGRFTKTLYNEIIGGQEVFFPGGVKRGETGTHVIIWKRVEPTPAKLLADPEAKPYFFLNQYVVFNAEQCDGILPLQRFDHDPIQDAQDLVREYVSGGPLMQGATGRAYYSPGDDLVNVPPMADFERVEAYYSTLYHELAHSTGHESRLDRLESTGFGSGPYAKEELVAEMTAGFLCGIAGIDNLDQSAAYVKHWLGPLEDDATFVVNAASHAQKAADLILGVTFDEEQAEAKEAVAA